MRNILLIFFFDNTKQSYEVHRCITPILHMKKLKGIITVAGSMSLSAEDWISGRTEV